MKIKKASTSWYPVCVSCHVDMDIQIIVTNHGDDSLSDAHVAGPVFDRMEHDMGFLKSWWLLWPTGTRIRLIVVRSVA